MTGSRTGVGVTHFCVLYANYLAGVQRERVAVLEWNQTGDLERMEKVCTGKSREQSPYRVLEVDYYKNIGSQTLLSCMEQGYHTLIIDFGAICGEFRREWHLCSEKILMGSFSEWQGDTFLELLKKEKTGKTSWIYMAAFGSEETRREVRKKLGISVWRVPLSDDVFQVNSRTMGFFEELERSWQISRP